MDEIRNENIIEDEYENNRWEEGGVMEEEKENPRMQMNVEGSGPFPAPGGNLNLHLHHIIPNPRSSMEAIQHITELKLIEPPGITQKKSDTTKQNINNTFPNNLFASIEDRNESGTIYIYIYICR